ncbi:hypothetical protein L6R49_04140 [Myxococcota bacterium]|nr:hypothetical protein [Myxococcota bacterium]
MPHGRGHAADLAVAAPAEGALEEELSSASAEQLTKTLGLNSSEAATGPPRSGAATAKAKSDRRAQDFPSPTIPAPRVGEHTPGRM